MVFVNSAAAFKCDDYRFDSLLAKYLVKDSVSWGVVCECIRGCTQDGTRYTKGTFFCSLSSKLTNHK